MKIAEKVLMFIGCLAVGILLSCGASVKHQTTRTAKKSPSDQILIKLQKLEKPPLYK